MKQISQLQKVILLIGVLAVVIGILHWGNTAIQTTTYTICSDKLRADAAPLTVVQISDWHNAPYADRLLTEITKLSPDIIAVTGDLVDSRHPDLESAMRMMERARKIAPVGYVPGNHESQSVECYRELELRLRAADVMLLDERPEMLEINGQRVRLLGVKDPTFDPRSFSEGTDAVLRESLENLRYDSRDGTFTLLLSHRPASSPDMLEAYAKTGTDLVLTGHAHGGQIRIPFVGGLLAPDQGLFPKYTAGMFRQGDTRMVVSRGLGASVIPIRVNNRPELVVVRLKGR